MALTRGPQSRRGGGEMTLGEQGCLNEMNAMDIGKRHPTNALLRSPSAIPSVGWPCCPVLWGMTGKELEARLYWQRGVPGKAMQLQCLYAAGMGAPYFLGVERCAPGHHYPPQASSGTLGRCWPTHRALHVDIIGKQLPGNQRVSILRW